MLCFCFVCLSFVYPILPVSLDCLFAIAPLLFSNIYLIQRVDSLFRLHAELRKLDLVSSDFGKSSEIRDNTINYSFNFNYEVQ